MVNTIQIKRSNVAGKVPTAASLEVGELAINFPDKKIYTKEPGGAVIEMTPSRLINANDANPGLRITQTGTGAALLVEDEANPDASPFVVGASGEVGIGTATPSRKFVVSDAGGVGLEIDPAVLGDGSVSILAHDRKTNLDVPIRLSAKSFSFETKTAGRLTITEDGTTETGGDMLVGTSSNPNNRRLRVNGKGVGSTWLSVTDAVATGNEVLLGQDPPNSLSTLSVRASRWVSMLVAPNG